MTTEELEAMADRVNAALVASGYRRDEARASVWQAKQGNKVLQRIYLNGRKANGYIFFEHGEWLVAGVNFTKLFEILEALGCKRG